MCILLKYECSQYRKKKKKKNNNSAHDRSTWTAMVNVQMNVIVESTNRKKCDSITFKGHLCVPYPSLLLRCIHVRSLPRTSLHSLAQYIDPMSALDLCTLGPTIQPTVDALSEYDEICHFNSVTNLYNHFAELRPMYKMYCPIPKLCSHQ